MLLCVFFSFIYIKGYKPQGPIIQGKKINKNYRSEFAAVFTGHTQGCV